LYGYDGATVTQVRHFAFSGRSFVLVL
jgi:hypothetical protein